jgi:hypothetical protein
MDRRLSVEAPTTLRYADPRGQDGDTEAVLDYQIEQVEALLALLTERAAPDLRWAIRNALMTDATVLDGLDHQERDPVEYAEGAREASLVARLHGAIGVARDRLDDLRAQRAVPLSERDPLGIAAVVTEPSSEPGLPAPPEDV